MKKALSVLAVSLMLSGCADNRNVSGDNIAWGQSVDGLQAGLISLKATSREPKANAILVFHLRNTGSKPVRIMKLSSQAQFWGEYLPIEVRANGAFMKYEGPVLEPRKPPDQSEFIYLQPKQTNSVEVQFFPGNWKLMPPYGAEVTFVFKNDRREEETVRTYNHETKEWTTVSDLWTGESRSGAVHVGIGP
jgi:hypothetical protein